MRFFRSFPVALLCAFAVLCAAEGISAGQEPKPKDEKQEKNLPELLEKQRAEYFAALRFCGGFVVREGFFDTEKDARTQPLSADREIARGFIAKSGNNFRLVMEYHATESNGLTISTGIPFDAIANDRFKAVFYPSQAGSGYYSGSYGAAGSRELFETLPELVRFATPVAPSILPLTCSTPDGLKQGGSKLDAKCRAAENDKRVRFRWNGRDDARGAFVKDVSARRISPTESLIDEVAFRFRDAKGETVAASITLVCEWRDVAGQKVPTRLRQIFLSRSSAQWIAVEWESGVLARRTPDRTDFIINIRNGEDVDDPEHNPEAGVVDLQKASEKDSANGIVSFVDGKRV